jgi:hypothetical protein
MKSHAGFIKSPSPKTPTEGWYVPRQIPVCTFKYGTVKEGLHTGHSTRFAAKGVSIGIYR